MRRIAEIYERLEGAPARTLAVAAAADTEVLKAVAQARRKGMVQAVLFGKAGEIRRCLEQAGEKAEDYRIVDCEEERTAAREAVRSVARGGCDVLMKGLLPSDVFLRAVLDKDCGIKKSGNILHAVAVMEICVEGEERLLFLTDPGFIPLPDLETKGVMIRNLSGLLRRLGCRMPKIAVLSAMEKVNPKILSSVEAGELEARNRRGELTGCVVGGPFSMDLAISKRSAKQKGFEHPVAGEADAVLAPSLEVGNAVLKTISYLTDSSMAGYVCGTEKPIVFTSRSDSAQTKLNTIALAVLLAGQKTGDETGGDDEREIQDPDG